MPASDHAWFDGRTNRGERQFMPLSSLPPNAPIIGDSLDQ